MDLASRLSACWSLSNRVLRGAVRKTVERYCREGSIAELRCTQIIDMRNAMFRFMLVVDGAGEAHGILTLAPKAAGFSRPETHLLWKNGLGDSIGSSLVMTFSISTYVSSGADATASGN